MNAVRKIWVAGLMAVAAALCGCGQQAPGCADPKTHELMSQMLFDSVAAQTNLSAVEPGWLNTVKKYAKVSVTTIRTVGTDKETGKVHCAAKLVVQLPNDAESADVEYTSQLTDDKSEHLVEMVGHQTLALIVGSMARKDEFKRATSSNNATTNPTRPTPPPPMAATPAPAPSIASTTPRTVDVTLMRLDCGDFCHLQYKTGQGELKSALCAEAPICQQRTDDPNSFEKHVGSHALLKLSSKFVPEGGETLDNVVGLEWR